MARTRAGTLLGTLSALAVLAGCAGSPSVVTIDATAGPAGLGSPGTTSSATSGAGSPTTSSSTGCPKGGAAVPVYSDAARAGDLDGDGRRDQVWLADENGKRYLGVSTAGGARFSAEFESPSPLAATAVGDRLADGSAVILLRTASVALLFAVVDCQIVPTQNKDGDQYSFDLGASGYGTGVGCPTLKTGKTLAGFNVGDQHDDGYTIYRTPITLSEGGRNARNGEQTDTGIWGPDSTRMTMARSMTCGASKTARERGRVS